MRRYRVSMSSPVNWRIGKILVRRGEEFSSDFTGPEENWLRKLGIIEVVADQRGGVQ